MQSYWIRTSSKVLLLRHCCLGFLFLVTSGLVACSSSQQISAAETAASAEKIWSVEIELSGGIAGIEQQILLDNTGRLTSINNKSGKRLGARADASLMAYAGEWVKARPLATTNQPLHNLPIGCADCINYNINIVSNGRRLIIRLNTLSLKSSPYGDLVKRMIVATQQLNRTNKTH